MAAPAGALHFWWLVKSDVREPLAFAAVLAVLFVPVFFLVVRRIFKGSERQRKMYAHELEANPVRDAEGV